MANKKGYHESIKSFHAHETSALLQKYRQVEFLIGSNHHNYSDGAYCEYLVRDLLRKVLPKRYSVDTGFIRGAAKKKKNDGTIIDVYASPQIDILIHDSINYAPIFQCDDFVVVSPDSVVGIIEVKKRLNKKELMKSLKNLRDSMVVVLNAQRLMTTDNIFCGVFSFDSWAKPPKPLFDYLKEHVSNYNDHVGLPDSIISLSDFLMMKFDKNGKNSNSDKQFKLYSSDDALQILIQLFLYNLFYIIDHPEGKYSNSRWGFSGDIDFQALTVSKV